MAQSVKDWNGKLFRAGASARLYAFPEGGPLPKPYLWNVTEDADTLYIESRPAGESHLLTEDLAKELIIFNEPRFLRPEEHSEIWNEILAMGWVVSAQKDSGPTYSFLARRVKGSTLAASPQVGLGEFHMPGTPDEFRARIFWRGLLDQLKNPPKSSRR